MIIKNDRLHRLLPALLALALLLALSPSPASASTYGLTSSNKTALDKLIAASDQTTARKLEQQYKDVLARQSEEAGWDTRIRELHYANEERIAKLRTAIRQIGDSKIRQLEQQVQQTKARYKPLLDTQTVLNRQIAAAKPLKDKELNKALKVQADQLRWAVQLARDDIRAREQALKQAKAEKTKTTKKLRDMLAGVDPIKVQIRSAKSTISALKKQAASGWQEANQAIRKRDASGASRSLASLVTITRQLAADKQKQHGLETKISELITRVEREMPRN